jgi:hypothetical protein
VRLTDAEHCVEPFRTPRIERECAVEICQRSTAASIDIEPAASLPRQQTTGINSEAFLDQ